MMVRIAGSRSLCINQAHAETAIEIATHFPMTVPTMKTLEQLEERAS
jgi:hypothetical protein